MLENQAFRWLKKSVKGVGSPTNAAIGACSDPVALVRGAAQDFEVLLRSQDADGASAVAAAAAAAADLTDRLERIKSLLYDERSASASSAAGGGRSGSGSGSGGGGLGPDWTPRVADGVLREATRRDVRPRGGTEERLFAGGVLPALVRRLPRLPFEARKSVAAIFNYLLVCGLDGADAARFASASAAFAGHVRAHADAIVGALVAAHGGTGTAAGSRPVDVALLCGSMLRSSLRDPAIYEWTLADGNCERLVRCTIPR